MKYFTSDLHLGDDRIGIDGKPNLFYRPFNSIKEQNDTIMEGMKHIKENDELYIVGDAIYDSKYLNYLDMLPKCKVHLVIGNYDIDKLNLLAKYFYSIQATYNINIGEFNVFLNHYPNRCLSMYSGIDFAIVGHVHGLWKVQRNMINVSTDAWHFKPVSEEEILFCYNAMINFYDENVFPVIL